MQNTKKFLILATLMLAACTSDPFQESPDAVDQAATIAEAKICNSSENAFKGKLIAKFNDEAIPALEQAASRYAATRSAMTRSGIESLDEILAAIHVTSIERVFPVGKKEARTREAGLHKWYILEFDKEQDLDEAARMLAGVAEISKIQFSLERKKTYDGKVYPFQDAPHGQTRGMVTSDFNDPNLFWQWHYINNADQAIATEAVAGADINVADAWKLTGGNNQVIVAIVDEGVKYTHPDLAANMWTNPEPSEEYGYQDIHGYNFADDGPITWDKLEKLPNGQIDGDSSHGTHVAGTVAAVNNNGIGVAGVAGGTGVGDGVRLMSCQVFSGVSNPSDEIISRAIKYAADHGASILQCSYGTSANFTSDRQYEENSPLEIEALRYFMAQNNCAAMDGGLAIYSAGNESKNISNFPGGYSKCISVTSIGPDCLPAYYTCYGQGCNIAAPGGEIVGFSGGERAGVLSTTCSELTGSDYGYMQGTSMACPHVSGVVALGLSYAAQQRRHFTADEFKKLLYETATPIDEYIQGTKFYYRYAYDLGYTNPTQMMLSNYTGQMGVGQVNAKRLLDAIAQNGTPMRFPNLYIPLDGEVTTLPATFFLNGESLTYTVTIENQAVATSRTEGAKIIFSGLKEGSTKASIAASDGTTHNFNITVRKSASGSGWL